MPEDVSRAVWNSEIIVHSMGVGLIFLSKIKSTNISSENLVFLKIERENSMENDYERKGNVVLICLFFFFSGSKLVSDSVLPPVSGKHSLHRI